MKPNIKYTSNGDSTFIGGSHTVGTKLEPREGATRPEMQDRKGGFKAMGGKEYYHSGGSDFNTGFAKAGWYSESGYFDIFRKLIRDIGLGKGSIESLSNYDFTVEILEFMEVWAYESIDYYSTHHDSMTLGNLNTDDFNSLFFIAAGFLKGVVVSNAIQQGEMYQLEIWFLL